MNHAAALFDSAIRFNSLLGMPAMTGKPVDGRPEQKGFLKALDSALEAGLDDAAVMSPLTAALGGEEKARDFLKAHVKSHTRVVGGKVVQVKEHDDHKKLAIMRNEAHALSEKSNEDWAGPKTTAHHKEAAEAWGGVKEHLHNMANTESDGVQREDLLRDKGYADEMQKTHQSRHDKACEEKG